MFKRLPPENSTPGIAVKTVCIATPDIFGPIKNGGIGTAFLGLAEALNEAGYKVTILFSLGARSEDGEFEKWVEFYAASGITLEPMPMRDGLNRFPMPLRRSWSCLEWLQENAFDIVFFADWGGLGYYSLSAKKAGLAFANTILVTNTHAPTMWARVGNKKLVDEPVFLLLDHLERKSVAWADYTISPSHHLLEWMVAEGWSLPEHSYVQPNCLGSNTLQIKQRDAVPDSTRVDELVFFGRLEPRKGLIEFCGALDRIGAELEQTGTKVVFLGKPVADFGAFNTHEFLKSKSAQWKFEWEVIDGFDSEQAINFLGSDNRVAVIPSLNDNSPMTIIECIANRIPFVASNVGGIPELVSDDPNAPVLFEPYVPNIAETLLRIVHDGVRIATPSWDKEVTRREWLAWMGALDMTPEPAQVEPDGAATPLVSVCVLHYNRPHLLRRAIDSIVTQNYGNFEIIVADDGSDSPEALETLRELEADFAARGWKVLQLPNRFRGAARNAAAREANGDYLLFLDDDNTLEPDAISIWVKAALRLNSDILTSIQYGVDDDKEIGDLDSADLILYVGEARAYGAFKNCYGDMNCLIKRDAYFAMGALNETYGFGHEDWELFSRAVLNDFSLSLVPKPLVRYKRDTAKYVRLKYILPAYLLNNIKPYCDSVAPDLKTIYLLAQGQDRKREQLQGRVRHLEAKMQKAEESLKEHKQLTAAALEDKAQILASTSWRLTAPLRRLISMIGRTSR